MSAIPCSKADSFDESLPVTFDVLSKAALARAEDIVKDPAKLQRFLIDAGILLENGKPIPELRDDSRGTHLY